MSNPTELIDGYIAMWNETDAKRRRELIQRIWTERARYADPAAQAEGHDAIDAMVAAVHQRFPGHRFTRTSDVEAHNGQLRFTWTLGQAGKEPVVVGTDFGMLAGDKLASMTGFFDKVALPA
jgi:hypothetical protein